MRFDVLGPLRAAVATGPVALPAGRTAAVLAWLVANAGSRVSLASIAEVACGGADEVGRAAALVRTIQRLLPDVLEVGERVTLQVPAEAIDARRFESLVDEGRRLLDGDPTRAAMSLTSALDLWRGEPYPELGRALRVMGEVDRLCDLQLTAVEELAGITLRGRVDYRLVAQLQAEVILHPERPRMRRQLSIALYRTGRQTEALEVLEVARRELPDPSYAVLQGALLQHAPGLQAGEL